MEVSVKAAAIVGQRLWKRLCLLSEAHAVEVTTESRLRMIVLLLTDAATVELTPSEVRVLRTHLRARLAAMDALGPDRRVATVTAARGMRLGGAYSATAPPPGPTTPT